MRAFIPTNDDQRTVRLADVPEPAPAEDEAVIAVKAYSIYRGETFVLASPPQDWRPGKDVAGTVNKAAADGSGPREGVRVVAHPDASGWAERVAVRTDRITSLPEEVDTVTAAALPLAGLTALRLLRTAGPVIGRRILITGASGGVGHYFTELAAASGAAVTAVVATPGRGHRLKEFGAEHVVYSVENATGPFDVILEPVGEASLTSALLKLKSRGMLIWFGQASRIAPTIDFFKFWEGPVSGTIRHFDYTDDDIAVGTDLATLVRLVASGKLHPEIGLVQDWSETADALKALSGREIRGNAVLTVKQD